MVCRAEMGVDVKVKNEETNSFNPRNSHISGVRRPFELTVCSFVLSSRVHCSLKPLASRRGAPYRRRNEAGSVVVRTLELVATSSFFTMGQGGSGVA